ncbi:unnamed protein product [Clonostachys rosea]|uniref:Uncharacterized protein n=1 Tax=Bionectria ochroleuca TaxID=29856 RepID=A0ABY6ULX9_BIOOC|nr:unnamed protein product [Clonostachys rosea]
MPDTRKSENQSAEHGNIFIWYSDFDNKERIRPREDSVLVWYSDSNNTERSRLREDSVFVWFWKFSVWK